MYPDRPAGAGAIDPSTRTIRECESRLASVAGRSHALLAPRATTALLALLRALDLPPGSEVLMPVTLCANPAYAVRWAGLRPLFAEVSPSTFRLDLEAAEELVRPHTRVLLAVPLFGHPLDLPPMLDFASRHHLLVIEDAAQALGVRHGDRPAGSVGLASVYSFGPGKIASAGGGAAILSDDLALLERAGLTLATLPSAQRDMGDTAARILGSLDRLPEEIEARLAAARDYRERLSVPGAVHPSPQAELPLWKYSILLPDRTARDAVTREMVRHGVRATNLYPPLSRFFPEARRPRPDAYRAAAHLFDRIVNLPLDGAL